ncbi:WD REPEATS REGION domain-containing protein [Citrus sinensis]|uniref:WD REPEATS REGION domain-containing protein n=1 Tax=Citrus sinensis TaxID=2711 RepID=A0ACB8P5W9_CITSI|nr:WD REPEATS REGION domain-containing protein [Citrus sinensis]
MGIFEPYRAIGYITSSVPFSVQRLGTENFVTVSVGKAFHIYNCAKLNLVLVGPQLPKKIRALASYRDYTFAAYGNHIAVVKRAHQVATWSRHSAKVNLLLLFGEHILSIDIDGNMFIWAFKGIEENLAPVGHVKLDDKFTPTCIMHPDTYLNKVKFSFYGFVIMVIVGSQEGSLQLWNISTKKKLYEFKGWGSSISSCVSSPALDVVAVGCSDGKIHVHNVRYDEELVTFTHSMRGAVTALAFSSDGQPLLASGASSGVISIWNLEKRRLQSVIREAHDNAIISLHFFANEPVLMSASADNSIKMWIFDTTDGDPRLLRFRSGHSAPPLCIRFYANGRHILSAGQDRAFRLFSVIQDQQSRELSQRHVAKRARKLKMKILFIALPCILKDSYLNSSAAVGDAYVWRLQNFVLGEHILRPCPENPTAVKACTISACGNFAVLGTAGGWIERFNLQSGISRGSYLDMSERSNYAHNGEVVGVACDSTNTLMISAGYHGDIKVWDFKGRDLKSRWEVGCSLVKIVYHRVNGHTDRITDFCFSEDGKWLLSSGMDGSLRIWDVILARQIDAIHVDVSITALSLSPNMDVLATAHVDQNGVYLWVNRCMFSGDSNIDSYASGKEIVSVKMPSVSSVEGCQDENSSEPDVLRTDTVPKDSFGLPTFKQQIPDLVTLSLLPKSQWQSLINLDIIKARNKPIEPPKKPEKAPFFLPSVPSLSGEILFKPSESTKEDTESLKVGNKTKPDIPVSQFIQLLHSCAEMKNFSAFTDYIKSLSPSTLDMELRMLQIIDHDDHQELDKRPEYLSIELLLDYLIHEISCRNNFEFIQAVIRLFLKIHGETVRCHTKLQDKARKLLEVQSAVWQKIDKMFQSARCVAVTSLASNYKSQSQILYLGPPYILGTADQQRN